MCSPSRPSLSHRQPSICPRGIEHRTPGELDLTPRLDHAGQGESTEERLNRWLREYANPRGDTHATRPREERDSPLVEKLKKLASIPTEVKLERGPASMRLSFSGATAQLAGPDGGVGSRVDLKGNVEGFAEVQEGEAKIRLSSSVAKPFKLESSYRDFKFSSSVTQERWEIAFSWGGTPPDFSTLRRVYTEAEAGVRGSVTALAQLGGLDDPGKVKEAVAPHVEPIKRAISTTQSIHGLRERISFGIRASGPIGPFSETQETKVWVGLTIRF